MKRLLPILSLCAWGFLPTSGWSEANQDFSRVQVTPSLTGSTTMAAQGNAINARKAQAQSVDHGDDPNHSPHESMVLAQAPSLADENGEMRGAGDHSDLATTPQELTPFAAAAEAALTKNPKAQEAQANLSAARERIVQSKAALYPNLNFSASKTHNSSDYEEGRSTSDPATIGLSLGQSLYDGGLWVAMKQVQPYVDAFESDLAAVHQGILLELAQVSVDLLQAREVARLAENNHGVTKRHLAATQARFRVGEITRTDVSQAKARLALAVADQISAKNDIAVSIARFEEVVGAPPQDGLLLPPVPESVLGQPLSELLTKVHQRPDIVAIQKRLQVAELEIDMEKAGHHPVVSFSTSASRSWNQRVSGRSDPVDTFAIGVGVELPIYSGGMTESFISQARSERDAAQAQKDRLLRQAAREVEEAFLDYRTAEASMAAFAAVVEAARDAALGMEQEFQVGARTALDLLDAQNELFSAETDLAKSRYAYLFSQYRLLQSIGRLDAGELGIEIGTLS
ncbi:MAG: TolC family outer membrane protein [Magnetococcales bacterium]|nr:TolC family outer membrane protein [Magnetococcales bacterium]